jgi:uncharacterized protein YqhQ
MREGSWYLAIAYFMTALLFSYVSLDPTTAKWFSRLILLPAVATYALGLNETINMIIKPFGNWKTDKY